MGGSIDPDMLNHGLGRMRVGSIDPMGGSIDPEMLNQLSRTNEGWIDRSPPGIDRSRATGTFGFIVTIGIDRSTPWIDRSPAPGDLLYRFSIVLAPNRLNHAQDAPNPARAPIACKGLKTQPKRRKRRTLIR
ncbi:unnamed protein product [Arabidopsis lyrata]|nr:unnamed protein product [Arabidopsis lyrata]CAH8252913.1 unnamed protein product [Arabidopsis lyrata]CAH8270230.1 unnamed protein product [Arabidopsis lyrata]